MAIRFSVEADGVTRTFSFKRNVVTFGRSATCTVCIDDPALSRTHCQIEVEEGACFARDLNSRNGTIVDGKCVRRAPLEHGTQIAIGTATIVFLGQEESTAELSAATDSQTAHWTATLFAGSRKQTAKRATGDAEREILRLQRLLAINRRIASELEPERVLTLILDSAVEFVDAERGFLVTVEDSRLYIPVARDFWRKDIPAPAFELSRSIALEVVRRGVPLITDDASEDDRFDERASVHDLRIRSVLCVPLKIGTRTIGAIYLDNRFTRGTFTQSDRGAIEAFADQAAISLANSNLYARAQEQGTRWKEEALSKEREAEDLKERLAQLERAEGRRGDYSAIVGRSDAVRRCLDLVDRVADAEIAVLIRGESGSGKELIARCIHDASPRRGHPFVVLSAAGLGGNLVESELFGHVAGAFTGGGAARRGLFEEADGGTVFLDEPADLPVDVQKRLLRVLESGEIRPVGSSEVKRIDVRLVAATSRDLESLIEAGSFREDFYYRLKGVEVEVPPLRDRGEDIPLLARHFLRLRVRLDRPEIAPDVLKALARYPWPGNVRELKNEIDRLAATAEPPFELSDLSPHIVEGRVEEIRDHVPGGLKAHLEQIEIGILRRVLAAHGGNKTHAAEALGLSRLGLRKKLTRLNLG